LRFELWVKSDSDIYYNKTSDKAATTLVTSDLGYTLGGPLGKIFKVRRLRRAEIQGHAMFHGVIGSGQFE
jgi:hypothetical protein